MATFAGRPGRVEAVAFSPDGTRVLTGSTDGTAWLWDGATSKLVATLAGHTSYLHAAAFSPDGARVLTGSEDSTARLWDAATGKAVATLAGHTGFVTAVAFSPDGTRVLPAPRTTRRACETRPPASPWRPSPDALVASRQLRSHPTVLAS